MALSSTTDRVAFSGNGSTTAFSFPYKFFAEADLTVILKNNTTGAEVTKTLTTHYTTTGAGTEVGGTVTMITAPATGETLIILRNKSDIQELALTDNGKIPSENIIKQLDKIVMMIQRVYNTMLRSVRLPEGFTATFDPKLPAIMVVDGYLKTDSAGTAFEYISETDLINLVQTTTASFTASRVLVSDSGGVPTSSAITSAQLLAMLPTTVGSRAAPSAIVAGTGITFSSTTYQTTMYVQGSGGSVVVSLAARIQAGTVLDQELTLMGCSDANFIDLTEGSGLKTGGKTIRLGLYSIAKFKWDGTYWNLMFCNDIIP